MPIVRNWDDISEVQSLEPVVDCNEDHEEGVPFPHRAGVCDPSGYAGCERTANGRLQLQKR